MFLSNEPDIRYVFYVLSGFVLLNYFSSYLLSTSLYAFKSALPSGVAVYVFLLLGGRFIPLVLLSLLMSGWLIGSDPIQVILISFAVLFESSLFAYLIKKSVYFNEKMNKQRHYGIVIIYSVLVSLISGLLVAYGLYAFGQYDGSIARDLCFLWWKSHAVCIACVSLFLFVWRHFPYDWFSKGRRFEAICCFSLNVISAQIVFFNLFNISVPQLPYLYFLPVPFMLWGAARFHRHGILLIIVINLITGLVAQKYKLSIFQYPQVEVAFWYYLITVGYCGVVLALLISNLKNKSIKIAENEKRYRSLVNHIPLCVHEIDLTGRIMSVNDAGLVMLEIETAEEIIGMHYLDIVCSSDKKRIRVLLFRAVDGKQSFFEFTGLYKHKEQIFTSCFIPLRDENGKVFRLMVYSQDVTKEKNRKASLELSSMVFNHSSEAMVISDHNNHIITVNQAFSELTGYQTKEVIGKKTDLFCRDIYKNSGINYQKKGLKKSGYWEGEIWSRKKNGEQYILFLRINTITTKDKTVCQYVSQFSDVTEKKRIERLIWEQANFDPLTELPNRAMLLEHLKKEIRKNKEIETSFTLLFIDLDHFKEINDSKGHTVGDQLLQNVASRLKKCTRQGDTVARLGGDEFCIILSGVSDIENIKIICEIMLQTLSKSFRIQETEIFLSASVGITRYPIDTIRQDEMMKYADLAMYAAKEKGRNCFVFFDKKMQKETHRKMQVKNKLHVALQNNELYILYQPIVHLKSGNIKKAEALIRWKQNKKDVMPEDFIPIAEWSGLIIDIGNWVFNQAAKQVKKWRERIDPEFQVSINVSPAQLSVQKDEDESSWLKYLEEESISGNGISVEITERLLMDTHDKLMSKLKLYQKNGIQIALDDFGTGYSSLSYLKKFNINYIKIDKSFVQGMEEDKNNIALCKAMIMMAHSLGLVVIAEGIETERQKEILRDLGCDYAQGYLFSTPVDVEKFEALF